MLYPVLSGRKNMFHYCVEFQTLPNKPNRILFYVSPFIISIVDKKH